MSLGAAGNEPCCNLSTEDTARLRVACGVYCVAEGVAESRARKAGQASWALLVVGVSFADAHLGTCSGKNPTVCG